MAINSYVFCSMELTSYFWEADGKLTKEIFVENLFRAYRWNNWDGKTFEELLKNLREGFQGLKDTNLF